MSSSPFTPSANANPTSSASDSTPRASLAEEVLQPLYDSLESGILLVGHDGVITSCSLAMAMIFGKERKDIVGLDVTAFDSLVLRLLQQPPQRLRDQGLFPRGSLVRCEEFELVEPSRTVVRWVARRVHCPHYEIVAVGTDITTEVDLTSAYEKMALTDRLTGIANRRGIEGPLHHELLRLRRFGKPLSFALFDVDHFKLINDAHGHGTGDEVLRLVAKAMAGTVRDTDLLARWGGEEFLVVMPETPRAGALVCAERIRANVAHVGFRLGFDVTVSGGIAEAAAGEPLTEILARADGQLYEAKNKGRNVIC